MTEDLNSGALAKLIAAEHLIVSSQSHQPAVVGS